MHSRATVTEARRLRSAGLSNCEISRRIGIPRSTIREWSSGRLPRSCAQVARVIHDPGAYVYLLGLYLGDGCISAHSPDLLLRGLIHSDGCRSINTGRGGWRCPRYSFSNLSVDIKQIFCDACDRLDIGWTEAPPKAIYVSRKADVARLNEFIGPKR
jgi:hypothetical protein